MKILHLDCGREMRGGQWQVLRLHRGLLERGHASVLMARSDSALLWTARKEGIPADELRAGSLRGLSRGYDLLHAHDARSHTLGALLAQVPLVVSRRVAFPVRDSALSRWKYRQPVLFIAVSNHVARQLRAAGIDNRRIRVVYDGVPVSGVPVYREVACGDGVLVPETSDPAKGMALALEAAALAGVPVKVSRSLEADLPGAGKLLYITHSEGLGSGILLAMSHGLTVIASNTGGIPELIQDGVNGYLVSNEAAGIAAALKSAGCMGVAARQTVGDRFTVAHMVDGTLEAYREALVHA